MRYFPSRGNKMTDANVNSKNDTIKSLLRAVRILEIISQETEIGIADLSRKAELSKSTVYRLVSTLEEAGCILQNPSNMKYHLSLKLFTLGKRALLQFDLRSFVRPFLKKMMSEVHETVVFGTLEDGYVVYLDSIIFPQEIQPLFFVGNRSPAHCTSIGKAILAHLPENEQLNILKKRELKSYTKNTITDISALRCEFQKIRARGYAVNNEERIPGAVSIAAPLRNYKNVIVGAISIHGFNNRITAERIEGLGGVVLRVSREISRRLGYYEENEQEGNTKNYSAQ